MLGFVAKDVANPRMIELEVANEILSGLFDIRTYEVDEMNKAEDGNGDALRSGVQSICCLAILLKLQDFSTWIVSAKFDVPFPQG
ncbi:MAG: hypothetical protein MUO26_08765 [Methanotrichaceae archaeon]|nr:hypothetical protein [Methanotrichaceae archaeon]